MTITYPLSFPSITGVSSIVIVPLSVVGITQSIYTLEEQVQAHQGQAWGANVTLPTMKRASGEEWIAFLLSLNGMEGTFLMGDPTGVTPRGSASSAPGTPVINGAAQTGNTLDIDGCPAGATGYLKKGDYIQLSSGATTRLHRVLTDADTDSAGAVTLDIWPNLRESPGDGNTVVVANTLGLFRLKETVQFPIDTATFYELSFACFEAI
jgi:hypothetical protein